MTASVVKVPADRVARSLAANASQAATALQAKLAAVERDMVL